MNQIPCRYCGTTEYPLVKKQSRWKRARINGLTVEPPCCGSCFQRIRYKNCVVTTTPTHISVEAGLKSLRAKIGKLSKRSTVEEILSVMSSIYSVERQQIDLNAQFKSKAYEAQCLAESLAGITSSLLQSKSDLAHLLSVSYETCRKIANNVIADKALRLEVFKRDSWRCLQCGTNELLSVDHKKAVVHGGGNELDNLQTLCLPCNIKKGSKRELFSNQ